MNFAITGSAGFIGYHLAHRLLHEGHLVVGIDSITNYYDQDLKRARLARLQALPKFIFLNSSVEEGSKLLPQLSHYNPETVIHLAAQAGVRYSAENPRSYIDTNLVGSWQLLELAKDLKPKHLMMASSSSVYGANSRVPFREDDATDQPISLYAATKKGMEVMAHAYSNHHQTPTTVLRFFTAYGPWGRPDMAAFRFVSSILKGEPIDVYDESAMQRDFTYIDDLVESVLRLVPLAPSGNASSATPYRVVNIGGGHPVALAAFIETIEKLVGKKAVKRHQSRPAGDVSTTFASTKLLRELTGYSPSTPLAQGMAAFLEWYKDYYPDQFR